jgi:hypothetical protein
LSMANSGANLHCKDLSGCMASTLSLGRWKRARMW